MTCRSTPAILLVHPRSRGEHLQAFQHAQRGGGSSPLPRGTPHIPGGRPWPGRFIPAPAGNTPGRSACRAGRPVHPRSRGEHGGQFRQPPFVQRFIPAPAGNTAWSNDLSWLTTVHPRSRGEHRLAAMWLSWLNGSSPLPRGTLPGKPGLTLQIAVHPRSRGEHTMSPTKSIGTNGSSPLPRGTLSIPCRGYRKHRFIPAPAGNTRPRLMFAMNGAVHPRSRGEHAPVRPIPDAEHGSSPLPRGTPPDPGCVDRIVRFIPAPAGNTRYDYIHIVRLSVHPRSRGEHLQKYAMTWVDIGSSPLPRGTLCKAPEAVPAWRFIPAPAGNTAATAVIAVDRAVHPRSRGEHLSRPEQLP